VLNDYLEINLLDWTLMPRSTTWGSTRRPAAEKAIRTNLRSGIRLAFAPEVRNVDRPVRPFFQF
jgi:hypothetical protein